MHGAPARVLAQHLGRNLRFKGSPLDDNPRSSICRHQCLSRQVTSRHASPVLGQRTTVVIETNCSKSTGRASQAKRRQARYGTPAVTLHRLVQGGSTGADRKQFWPISGLLVCCACTVCTIPSKHADRPCQRRRDCKGHQAFDESQLGVHLLSLFRHANTSLGMQRQ
jgi:hypothetical protein